MLGEFEYLVLSATMRLGEGAYGVSIRREIELTAQRGYAEDREENEQSIWCYGAAILGADGNAVGCVSISMPMFRREADAQRCYIDPLLAACRTIGARLGPVCPR